MALSYEQKKSLAKLINALALIIFLLGIFTTLYQTTTGLMIALIIWILQKPVLSLFGLEVIKHEHHAEHDHAPTKKADPSTAWRVIAIIAIILLVLSWLGNTVFGQDGIWFGRGSGTLTTEDRTVSDFTKIELNGSGTVNITQGDTEALTIEAEDNVIDRIESRVSNGTLHLGMKSPWYFFWLWPTRDITYELTVQDLNALSISGSGTINSDSLTTDQFSVTVSGSGKAKMKMHVQELEVDISGSGEFDLSGTAVSQLVDINGSGKYDAKNLLSKSAEFSVSGSGQGIVNVSDELQISISGSGKVEYIGSPKISQEISGSGKIQEYNGVLDLPSSDDASNTNDDLSTNSSTNQ